MLMKKKKEHKVEDSHEFNSSYEEGIIDLATIDSKNIDFNFEQFTDAADPVDSSDYQSINPLKAFSHRVELNLEKLNNEGYITPDISDTILSSTYRVIKRPLLNNAIGKGASEVKNANLIMLTSALPFEGKTFSAINLAISIAMEKNKHVLLIDADINKPSHFKIFDIDKKPGLTDILLGEVDNISDVLCRTNIPSMAVMSTGKMYDYSTELLASEAMENFINDISTRYKDRVIIFDSPPLIPTTEASVLASHMGQVVMVVEAENTQKHVVKKALDLLSNEIVMLLLNKQREKNKIAGYGYGYGYGHSQSNGSA